MKTILVCNQKGGVGKSLVADEIAFSFERSGIPVSFYDLDTQGGTLHTTHEADGAQVAVVDTPGALQEGLADWLKEADVVVIPTRNHVEGHRAADAHAQGGVQERPREDCLRDERVEPLQGVPRLHGVVRGSGRRPDGDHAAPVRGVRSGGSRRQVRGRVRLTRQGGEGDSRFGGHGARGCGVPEGITAGQRRYPSGQMCPDDV